MYTYVLLCVFLTEYLVSSTQCPAPDKNSKVCTAGCCDYFNCCDESWPVIGIIFCTILCIVVIAICLCRAKNRRGYRGRIIRLHSQNTGQDIIRLEPSGDNGASNQRFDEQIYIHQFTLASPSSLQSNVSLAMAYNPVTHPCLRVDSDLDYANRNSYTIENESPPPSYDDVMKTNLT